MNLDIDVKKRKLIKDFIWLRSKINFDFIFDKDEFSQEDIRRYYKKTKFLLYRLGGSKEGYMHIGVSDDGLHKKGENYQTYHLNKINDIIKKHNFKNVLELGSGQGANMAYLAKTHPNVNFTGIDLYPSLDKKNKKYNISLIEGDYHNLKQVESNSMDFVYAIETLCYSTNKNQIFKEVNRVLKKDGIFVIFDAYLAKERSELSEIEAIGAALVENGYYLDEFEFIGNIDNYIKENNFEIILAENLKNKVINHLYAYQDKIKKLFKFGSLFSIFCKMIPKEVLGNIVPIYFMANTVDLDLSVYYYHVLKKK
ncbi:MAG: class I SAM-dependent methyltransferase [Erysipelotrichales bacterium]|nr:class I SAM-dependent methyltransferase [Erysipelotrichales bacterium]